MSQREIQKKREVVLEEDKDFYLSFLNKKLRNSRKKLEQIDELSKKDVKTLKPEQIEKINSRNDVLGTIQYFEELKDIYYTAYKVGLEEGKVTQKESSIDKNGKSNQGNETANAAQGGKQFEISKDEIVRETLHKVLNLLTFSQIVENPRTKEGLTRYLEREEEEKNTNIEDLGQFCQNLQLLQLQGSFDQEEKRNSVLDKLVSYVNADESLALGNSSFKYFQETIERIVEKPSFGKVNLNQKEDSNNSNNIEPIQEAKVEATKVLEQESSTGAAVLKPDQSDSNSSPGNTQYLPKVVRFVDEIEKDMLTSQSPKRDNSEVSNEPVKGILKESTSKASINEEEREDAQGDQDQKSFRKKRNNDYTSKNFNNERRGQSNRGGQYYNGKKGYSGGYKENRNTRGIREYQVKQYVEKKPQEAQE